MENHPSSENQIEYMSDKKLEESSLAFLDRYYDLKKQGIPIPIEHIVEYELKMDIIPLPGLHGLLNIDGFLGSDLCSIYVDKSNFEKNTNRYRFTLAHEVGHLNLHSEYTFSGIL